MYIVEQIKRGLIQSIFLSFEAQGATSREVQKENKEKSAGSEVSKTPEQRLQEAAKKTETISRRIENNEARISANSKALQTAEKGGDRNSEEQIITGQGGNDTVVGESAGDIINTSTEAPTEANVIAGVENLDTILSEIGSQQPDMVISDSIKLKVTEGLTSDPIEGIENMSEIDIQSEIARRTIALKVEEQNTRILTQPAEGVSGETEADFIAGLEEKFQLDANSLASLRAENQTGIGTEIDTSGEINNPEEYKTELIQLAKNAQRAQEYAAQNKKLLDAGNQTILANVAAIIDGKNPEELSAKQTQSYRESALKTQSSGDGFSSLGRITGSAKGGFSTMGSGIGTVNTNPLQLKDLPPASVEKAGDLSQLFGSAIEKYDTKGEFAGWNKDSKLHQVVMKESGGIVGRLNYTFQKVADQMGTKIDDPQFVTYIHNKLKEGAKAKDFGIVSTACGVGQFIRANVLAYYPEGFDGIGDPDQECIGMLRYIKDRYGNPTNTVAQYGKHHEGY